MSVKVTINVDLGEYFLGYDLWKVLDNDFSSDHLPYKVIISNPTWDLELARDWLEDQVGQRHHTWTYSGGNIWLFLNKEDADRFLLAWA